MKPWLDDGDVRLYHGDCLEVMRELDAESIDAVVTDPPYGLGFMGHEWDQPGEFGPVRANGTPGQINDPRQSPRRRRQQSQQSPASGAGHARQRNAAQRGEPSHGGAMHAGRYDLSHSANARYQAWCEAWATECLRVLKPGGHLVSFGGTRTYHRLAAGIEDAGFEIRDCLAYMYGSGFPKSLNVGAALDKNGGRCACEPTTEHDLLGLPAAYVPPAEGDQRGSGSLLLAGLPEQSASQPGATRPEPESAGGSEPGLEGRRDDLAEARQLSVDQVRAGASVGATDGPQGRLRDGASPDHGDAVRVPADAQRGRAPSRPRSDKQRAREPRALADESGAQAGGAWPICDRCCLPLVPDGLGTALKPAYEPITLARKPLAGTVAANVLAHGTGALNIDACRIGDERTVTRRNGDSGGRGAFGRDERTFERVNPPGRWPANVILDAEAAAMLDEQTGELASSSTYVRRTDPRNRVYGAESRPAGTVHQGYGDPGGASRFFYTAKASAGERNDGLHDLPERAKPSGGHGNAESDPISIALGSQRTARNTHPTVKPVDLMRWLVRLLVPPGALILDPFGGSGTTGVAARRESVRCILIEREAEYLPIIAGRLSQQSLFGGAA